MSGTYRNRSLLFTLILVSIGLFCSCNKKKELHFYYSDGSEIKDSTVIRFLTQQLPLQVPGYDSTMSLGVKTVLDREIEPIMERYFAKDPARRVSGMVILENKTGNLIYCKSSGEFSIYSQRIQTMKLYGILLSFEKGVKPEDTFSWTGRYTKKKYDSTVSRLYRISAPSLEYKYPFDTYSCGEWSAFLKRLDVSENERDCADGEIYPRYYFRTSLFDLVKTGVLISQNGVANANNLFGDIKDADGKLLHRAVHLKRRRLRTDTCLTAKKALKHDPFDVIEFSYPTFLYTHKEIRNGMVLSTKKYTIGFLDASKSRSNGFVTKEIYSLVSLLEHSKH